MPISSHSFKVDALQLFHLYLYTESSGKLETCMLKMFTNVYVQHNIILHHIVTFCWQIKCTHRLTWMISS